MPSNQNPLNATYWTEKSWLAFLAGLLILLVSIYILLHTKFKQGSDRLTLNVNQLQRISSIAHATNDPIDSGNNSNYITPNKAAVISNFLDIEFGRELDSSQKKTIIKYLLSSDIRDGIFYLSDIKLIVKSYFWLTGPEIYLEVIFWALFGAIGSLLYYVSNAERKKDDKLEHQKGFDTNELSYQVAKFFYAPLCTLILVIGYSLFADQSLSYLDANKSIIVFSFISGFYSGRMMNFLDKLKDLIFPNYDISEVHESSTMPLKKVNSIKVNLKLSDSNLTADEKSFITDAGWDKAEVTLKSMDNLLIQKLEKPVEEQGNGFTAKNIPHGTYNLSAIYSAQANGSIINFEGEEQILVNGSKEPIEIEMKKSIAEG